MDNKVFDRNRLHRMAPAFTADTGQTEAVIGRCRGFDSSIHAFFSLYALDLAAL
jgi:hypothetical protein